MGDSLHLQVKNIIILKRDHICGPFLLLIMECWIMSIRDIFTPHPNPLLFLGEGTKQKIIVAPSH